MTSYTIMSAAIAGFADQARRLGLDPEAIARRAGVPAAALVDTELHIKSEAPALMLAEAAALSGDEAFALRLAAERRLAHWGAVGLILREQATLREVLRAIQYYIPIHNQAVRLVIAARGQETELRVGFLHTEDAKAARQSIELAVATFQRILGEVMRGGWRPLTTCFRHGAPKSLAVHHEVLGPNVAFEQNFDGLICPTEDLDLTVPGADPTLARRLESLLSTAVQPSRRPLAEQVTEQVFLRLAEDGAPRDVIADALGLSPRTLQRRLAEEGAMFAGLLEDVRIRLARRYVDGSSLSFAEIAGLLGYSSQPAFNHWYIGRHGETPTTRRAATRGRRRAAGHNRETAGG